MNFILKSDKYHPAMIQVQLTPRSVGQQIPGDRYRGITHNSHCVPCYPWMYPLRLRNFRLQAGITCRIRSLGSNPRIADRLAQMGILPGIEVTVLRIGPMGNPLELAVGGSQAIALRASETDTLDCELVSLPPEPGPVGWPDLPHQGLAGRPTVSGKTGRCRSQTRRSVAGGKQPSLAPATIAE